MIAKHLISRLALALSSALLCSAASAQDTTVRLLVGYTAGGPTDVAARLLAPLVAKELGHNVVVENKPGANATLAGDMVAKAAPDAPVLWFAASPTVTISPHLMVKFPFDPQRDLLPLAPVVSYYNVLVVPKESPYKTVAELTGFARANPGKVTYGSAGVGGSNHLSGELFAQRTGTQMTHVPYKGNAPAMTDVIGGQITMMFDIVSGARPHIAADKVRALAVTSPRRNPSLPDVPTMVEAGVKDFDVGGWFAVYGPPKMPPAQAARVTQAFANALKDPALKARLEGMGFEVWAGEPSALDERGRQERALWGTVTKGIKVE